MMGIKNSLLRVVIILSSSVILGGEAHWLQADGSCAGAIEDCNQCFETTEEMNQQGHGDIYFEYSGRFSDDSRPAGCVVVNQPFTSGVTSDCTTPVPTAEPTSSPTSMPTARPTPMHKGSGAYKTFLFMRGNIQQRW